MILESVIDEFIFIPEDDVENVSLASVSVFNLYSVFALS
jgi:hypothetical protein